MAEKLMTDGSMALREKQYRVITIEATEKPQNAKSRVAAYARVSSVSDDQLNSFAAQNRHYSDLISSKENWRMVDIYADEGTPIAEDEITNAFIRLYYKLKHHGEPILMEMITSLQAIRNRRMLWSLDVIELNKQISDLTSQNQMLATLKQQGLIDPDIFISQSNELTEQLRAVKLKKERLLTVDGDNTIAQTRELMEILNDGPDFLDSFDAELFGELVETIIVESNERIRFRLKNELELAETIERTVR
ncbi:recombinase family protein [Allofournierella massiliensis]|uniref:Resolvase-like protein n=1 Tax=Allofournierella massiliensis TaxID=1650663 RepID=A0A4R1QUJ7_9FIRM|nr:hypothetical protein [Fournierella massiliensis]TCL56761.1 hypothetical protein EDD77_11274 [Fournierella massiliensis]